MSNPQCRHGEGGYMDVLVRPLPFAAAGAVVGVPRLFEAGNGE